MSERADRGLAAERTALAWRRTAVAAMFVGVLLMNHAVSSGWGPAACTALVAALTMGVLAAVCYRRNRQLHAHHIAYGAVSIMATTVAVIVVAVLAATTGFMDPWVSD